jgi:hypothetical protein
MTIGALRRHQGRNGDCLGEGYWLLLLLIFDEGESDGEQLTFSKVCSLLSLAYLVSLLPTYNHTTNQSALRFVTLFPRSSINENFEGDVLKAWTIQEIKGVG